MRPIVVACAAFLCAACNAVGPVPPALFGCAGADHTGPDRRPPLPPGATALAPGPASGLTDRERAALAAAFDRAVSQTGAPSMTAAVWQAGGAPWSAGRGAGEGRLHYWASVGKILTAAAVLRLAGDGRLSLDHPVADWLEQGPDGETITLRMLLDHTSGLGRAGGEHPVRASGGRTCPGSAWRYSNAGYALLGAVIEKETGKTYAAAVADLVLSRSGARAIRVLAPDDALADVVPLAPAPGSRRVDPADPQAAGGVVADAPAMAVFLVDLFSGRILPRETVASMVADLSPMDQPGLWYGRGMMVYDVPGADGPTVWIGHSGGVPGAKAVAAWVPSMDAVVAVALTGDGSAEASANLLLSALDRGPRERGP